MTTPQPAALAILLTLQRECSHTYDSQTARYADLVNIQDALNTNECSFTAELEFGEFIVCDESDKDMLWDESLESYLEDCVYPELPESVIGYFDDEKWKRDARFDGAGHALSSYDGSEYEVQSDGKWFYAFRVN